MLAAACSSAAAPIADTPSATRSTPSPSVAASVAGPATVPEVLDFEAPALAGGTLKGADYSGKDLAIWFWAPW